MPRSDSVQLALVLSLDHSELEALQLLYQTCSGVRQELLGRGWDQRTVTLCSFLAAGSINPDHVYRLRHLVARRLDACSDPVQQKLDWDARAFLQRWAGWELGEQGGVCNVLQAAYQEPDASFLSRGAATTAGAVGLRLLRWAGKPQDLFDVPPACKQHQPRRHSSFVSCVGFSPDGTRIVTGSYDRTVKIWEVTTGMEVRTLRGHSDCVTAVSFSPDGTRIVSGSHDNLVKIWNAETGSEVLTIRNSDRVDCVCFSPDGKLLVSGANDDLVTLWDARTGAEVRTLRGHSDCVSCVGFSPDGTRVVSGGYDQLVKIWDANTGAEVRTLTGHSECVTSVCFSPDGKRVVSGSEDNRVRIWDAETGRELSAIAGYTSALVYSPSGDRGPDRTRSAKSQSFHILTTVKKQLRLIQWTGGGVAVPNDVACFIPPGGGGVAAPEDVASFIPPGIISAVGGHGQAVCVGCSDGTVCFLQAPFLPA